MKRFFTGILTVALLLTGNHAGAQLVIGAGYLHVIEQTKDKNQKTVGDPDHMGGFYVGAGYNFLLNEHFGFVPGLYMEMLLQSEQETDGGSVGSIMVTGAASYHYTELALRVPLHIQYKLAVSDNVNLFAFAGPSLQCYLMGRSTASASLIVAGIGDVHSDSFDHYGKGGDGRRFNILVNGGIGVEIGDILFSVGYDRTLLNMSAIDGYKIWRDQIRAGISIGF